MAADVDVHRARRGVDVIVEHGIRGIVGGGARRTPTALSFNAMLPLNSPWSIGARPMNPLITRPLHARVQMIDRNERAQPHGERGLAFAPGRNAAHRRSAHRPVRIRAAVRWSRSCARFQRPPATPQPSTVLQGRARTCDSCPRVRATSNSPWHRCRRLLEFETPSSAADADAAVARWSLKPTISI